MNDGKIKKKYKFLTGLTVAIFLFFCSLYTKFFIYVFKKLMDYQGLKIEETPAKILANEFLKRHSAHDMVDVIRNNVPLKSIYDKKKELTENIKNYGSVGLIRHAKPPQAKESKFDELSDRVFDKLLDRAIDLQASKIKSDLLPETKNKPETIEMSGSLNSKDIKNAIYALEQGLKEDLDFVETVDKKEVLPPKRKTKKKPVSLNKNKSTKATKHKSKNKRNSAKKK